MKVDKRATLQLRIWINKHIGSKNSVHTLLAQIITEYSHGSAVTKSMLFANEVGFRQPDSFLCVTEVQSPFWCRVVQLRPHQVHGYGAYRVTKVFRKRIFKPYSDKPFLKSRETRYYLVQ